MFAAKIGHLNILKWSRENGCPWCKATCWALEVLQLAREYGCDWDESVCAFAAYHGHLNILQWARENNCPWNSDTCAKAARSGHFDCYWSGLMITNVHVILTMF